MRIIRNNVFETNSSSTHALTLNNFVKADTRKEILNLLNSEGKITIKVIEMYSESDYSVYSSFYDKLRFTVSLMISFMIYEKRLKVKGWHISLTRNEIINHDSFKSLISVLSKRIKGFTGIRFARNTFDENKVIWNPLDEHHLQGCKSFSEYLNKNHMTLEHLLFTPGVVYALNVD